jgi:hypothetical protein
MSSTPYSCGSGSRVGQQVVEEDEVGDAAIDVVGGQLVGMRVVPERGGGLVDCPAGRPRLPGCDQLVGTAIGGGGQVHPVPVDGGRLRELVSDPHLDVVAAVGAQGGAEEGAVRAPALGGLSGDELGGSALQGQVEDLLPILVACFEERRDLQLVLEAKLPNVARPGAVVERAACRDQSDRDERDDGQGPDEEPFQRSLRPSCSATVSSLAPPRISIS